MNIQNRSFLLIACLLFSFGAARAQSFNGDARRIAMGAIGYSDNITSRMMEEERRYRSFVVPLGLIQLVRDRSSFNPDDGGFDPILAVEYAANPLNFVFDRSPGGARGRLVKDILDGKLSRDLNAYRGFIPTGKLRAEGLAHPSWGKTFKLYRRSDGSYQGFFAGAGPYISAKTDLDIDQDLIDIFKSSTNIYKSNESFRIMDRTTGQLALAVTGGYRARFALPGAGKGKASRGNGIYVGVNYHYLHGFRYEDADLVIQFNTDSQGLVTLNPQVIPVVLNYSNSRSGRGFAVDVGIGAVVDRWEFGFDAKGIGNRIDWNGFTLKQFSLDGWSIYGVNFVKRALPAQFSKLKVELPVEYAGNVGYRAKRCFFAAQVAHGYQGTSFHGGAEYRLGVLEFRAGGRYRLDRWHPSGGVGLNLGRKFSVDVAAFGTTTNIERQLKPGIAISLRLNRTES